MRVEDCYISSLMRSALLRHAVVRPAAFRRSFGSAAVGGDGLFFALSKRLSNEVVTHAKGSYVYTEAGGKYLDFTTGIGVCSTGHCHPTVTERCQKQCATAVHVQTACYRSSVMLELIEELKPIVPEGLDTFFFANRCGKDTHPPPPLPPLPPPPSPPPPLSAVGLTLAWAWPCCVLHHSGAEAVEGAVRLARHVTGRNNIIAFQVSPSTAIEANRCAPGTRVSVHVHVLSASATLHLADTPAPTPPRPTCRVATTAALPRRSL